MSTLHSVSCAEMKMGRAGERFFTYHYLDEGGRVSNKSDARQTVSFSTFIKSDQLPAGHA